MNASGKILNITTFDENVFTGNGGGRWSKQTAMSLLMVSYSRVLSI